METREIRPSGIVVTASVKTDTGCVREANEDNGRHVVQGNVPATLTIVADGMGGHSSGEVASEMAVDLIGRYFYAETGASIPAALEVAIARANAEIYQRSTSDLQYAGMGTTVVALAVSDRSAYAAHVGDSRLYRLRGRHMEVLTLDHSQVVEMVKMGLISWEDAQKHEDKNVILRALGTQSNVEVEISGPFEIEMGDEFLLCSDGLSDMVDDEEIATIWADAPDLHAAVEMLVDRAKQNGGSDNITVGIVRVTAENENIAPGKAP
ncbi:MAG: Stp1/IreP family PP2C-type Ser/Thr phosphatase [Pyrinomonadaceae bacterium]